ncbi:hypothetical protein NM208_g8514 [Fusarium decemcellulare]|uniref:Uncharacterized protein n=1 Tax=Fusarium decemcellulare TaxID=57161 RepID=A0ACC1S500_9HYPO|nr:hypothetical protein NM208_g8514 [Fusarium decemcellulare]
MHLSHLFAVGLLPQLPCALSIPLRRGVDCGFSTSASSDDTCESFASSWGLSVDALKLLNPGVSCPDLDTDGFYCVVGTVNDDEPTAAGPSSTARVSTQVPSPSTTTTKTTPVVKPSPTKEPSGNGIETPPAIQEGMVSNCNKFHDVKSTTTCKGILDYNKISLEDFVKWNPAVGKDCSNLWQGTSACVGIIGGSSSPTTTVKPSPTTPANGIKTPGAIQEGMVSNCNKFHEVKSTTTCKGILDYNKISLADFIKWNPAVGKDCSNLWQGTSACVGVIGGSTSPITTVKPSPTTPGNGIKTPLPIQDGMVSNCNKFHPVKSTTTCQGILEYNKITLADFVKWNPAVGKDCSNLWKDTNACGGVVGSNPTPTQTAGNGVKTPSPIQSGMVKNCVKFHPVKSTTTCQGILDYNKITLANFVKWNPAVGKDCSNLWKDTYACVAVA